MNSPFTYTVNFMSLASDRRPVPKPWLLCARALTPCFTRLMRDPQLELRITYGRAYDVMRDYFLHRFDCRLTSPSLRRLRVQRFMGPKTSRRAERLASSRPGQKTDKPGKPAGRDGFAGRAPSKKRSHSPLLAVARVTGAQVTKCVSLPRLKKCYPRTFSERKTPSS